MSNAIPNNGIKHVFKSYNIRASKFGGLMESESKK